MTASEDPDAGQHPAGPPPGSSPGDAPPPGYGALPPGYGAPPPGYGAPPAYGAPPPGYGALPSYGPPPGYAGGYGAAPSPFGQPGGPQLASWGARVGASLLDGLLMFGIVLVAVLLGALASLAAEALFGVVVALGYLAALGFYGWQLWVQGSTGQTIGKRKVGIRLLREQDGRPVGGGMSIARPFVHYLDTLPCYLGWLWPLWDDKRQTFTDKILSSVVIRA